MNQRTKSPLKATAATVACAMLVTSVGTAFIAPASATTTGPTETPISEIQGTGTESPLKGQTVTTRGFVTASYPTGGIKGFVIQTQGTGPTTKTADASDAVFVYSEQDTPATAGTYVQVTGLVDEYYGLTQIKTPVIEVLDATGVTAPQPLDIPWPATDDARESLESMLVQPTDSYTVTDTYGTNVFGEVFLAYGTTPLIQPTDVALPGTAEALAVEQDNQARRIVLDDGSSTRFTTKGITHLVPPYISLTDPVRVGAAVTFDEPFIIDYRNSEWRLNPTRHTEAGDEAASFENTRTAAPDAGNIGAADITVASFNVLNYFTTGGNDACTSYKDRADTPITVNSCPNNGPRGAWDATNLARQEEKLVAAINSVDASVIGLMEIENSAILGETPDEATHTLVAALNKDAGTEKWAVVDSSVDLPPLSEQDAITNAIIYQPSEVVLVGSSRALGDQSSEGEPFTNAREPLGQAFVPVDGGTPMFLAVNHFKSKGSAGPLAGDADANDGQGTSNASRVAQANALVKWVPNALKTIKSETGVVVKDVALLGDFNSYTEEDPMHVMYEAGYTNAVKAAGHGEYTYSYSKMAGSLDHVLYNSTLAARVTGADVWEINSGEALLLEYSRYNNQGALYHAADAYRSSDHDPVIVGLVKDSANLATVNVLDINDFHGRIDGDTVRFAGAIEKSRKQYGDSNTLFLSAGDNIGASLFASAIAQDKPTIDMLNALELDTSVVGNHEFDQGLVDLEGRVNDTANFHYLGANVYSKGTTRPVLEEFDVFEVDGIRVGIIGAVTEETPSLVSPAGISDIDFGDPVEAVNRVAAKLTDGKEKNGEADVLIALYHEGAGAGTPEKSSLAAEVAAGGAFAKIVTETDRSVGAIFTGHTHKQYAWLAENGILADRPVIQTGNYGELIGQSVLKINKDTKQIVSATANNLPRLTAAEAGMSAVQVTAANALLDASLIAEFPRVAEVNTIVTDAIAASKVVGNQIIGSLASDITRAKSGDNAGFVDGKWLAPTSDNRAEASAMGTLVANSLFDTLSSEQYGGAEIGVVNPGGLRADLAAGDITYAGANAVLPFVNNLWTTKLTGAQVKTMLEQQWQTNADGTVPSRPYLQLGLSSNITYTYDDARDAGDRITTITVNGAPIDPARLYTVGTFSFLATGGDNFRVFNDATGTRDTGLIDRDAWIAYLQANPGITADFARSGVKVGEFPTSVKTEETFEVNLNRLNTFSNGAPENTSVTARFEGGTLKTAVPAGTAVVTADAATLKVTVPVAAAGAGKLVIVGNGTAVTITLPIAVTASAPALPAKVDFTVGKSVAGAKTTLSAKVDAADGKIEFREGTKVLASVPVVAKKATASVALNAGKHNIVAVYVAKTGDEVKSGTVTVLTAKASAKVTAKLSKTSVTYPNKLLVNITVSSTGVDPTGTVDLYNGSKKVGTAKLKVGAKNIATATIQVPKFNTGKYSFEVRYVGNANVNAAKAKTATLTVKKQKSSTKMKISNKGRTITVTTSATVRPSGKVTLKVNGKSYTKTLKNGKATFKIAKPKTGKRTYKISYAGSKNTATSSKTVKYTVR